MPVDESVVHSAPAKPGVYVFKDARGRPLYVGKAKNIRARLRTYLRPEADGRERILFMVREAEDLEFIVTSTESEALLLENNLIKKHRPPYNVYFRDDKEYLCVRVDTSKDFPRFELVRKVKRDGALYFGPFSSAKKIRQVLNMAGKLFPMRTCTDSSFRKRKRPCTQYQIKRCLAPCVGYVDKEAYAKLTEDALRFLAGDFVRVKKNLTREMKRYAKRLMFEEAALVRDRISLLDAVAAKQSVVNAQIPDADVFGFYRDGEKGAVSVLFLRNCRVIDGRSFLVYIGHASDEEFVASVASQYYGEGAYIPREVILPAAGKKGFPEGRLEWGTECKATVRFPTRGKKRDLLELARRNAEEFFAARRKREMEYEELANVALLRLKLRNSPARVECFDISHHGGKHPVGSMVVFEYGIPVKKSYRKFKVRTVSGVDDFAMMGEVVGRRVDRGEDLGPMPDLIVIDGGKGHLSAVGKVLSSRSLTIDVVAIAKGGRRRGGHEEDRIYIPGRKNPLLLAPSDPLLLFLKRVRDEAHRFAVTYQRTLHESASVTSLIEGFPGMGEKRVEKIFSRYGSLEEFLDADPAEAASLLRIPESMVIDLKDYLRAHVEKNSGSSSLR